MSRSLAVAILGLLPTFLLPAPGETQTPPADPVKQLPAGLTYEIDAREKGVRVPLTLQDKVSEEHLEVAVLDAGRGLVHNPALLNDFKPEITNGSLVIFIPRAPLPQGTYDVRVQVRLNPVSTGIKEIQILDLRITQPAAQLRTPETLVIERSVGPLGGDVTPWLPLKETSGRSGLSNVKIDQLDKLPGAGKGASPALKFTPLPAINPNGMEWAQYSLETGGGLPLGIAKGTLEVSAPQLAAPVAVPFEIRTRRTVWWILVFVPLGLICGWLLRTKLPDLVSFDQARLQAIDVLSRIDRERSRRKDSRFRAQAETIRADLETAIQSRKIKADVLTQTMAAAVDALNRELAALEERLAAARRELEQLSRVVETRWLVPKEMQDILSTGEAGLSAARQELLQGDAQAAVTRLAAARDPLTADLARDIGAWPEKISRLLRVLEDPELPVPANMGPGLAASLQSVRGLLSGVTDPGPAPDLAMIEQLLGAIHKTRSGSQKLLLEMKDWPTDTIVLVDAVLLPAPLQDPAAMEALPPTADDLLKTLDKLALVPDSASAAFQLAKGLQVLAEAWSKALLAQLAADQQEEIGALLREHRYETAAREVVQRLKAAAMAFKTAGVVEKSILEGLEISVGEISTRTKSWTGIAGSPFGLPEWAPARPPLDLSPGKIDFVRLWVERELRDVTRLRTALVWVGIIGLGFLLFRDKLGTLQDFAEVFFWGFGTDVTVDAFWNAAKGYKKV